MFPWLLPSPFERLLKEEKLLKKKKKGTKFIIGDNTESTTEKQCLKEDREALGGRDICIIRADLHCCMAETN